MSRYAPFRSAFPALGRARAWLTGPDTGTSCCRIRRSCWSRWRGRATAFSRERSRTRRCEGRKLSSPSSSGRRRGRRAQVGGIRLRAWCVPRHTLRHLCTLTGRTRAEHEAHLRHLQQVARIRRLRHPPGRARAQSRDPRGRDPHHQRPNDLYRARRGAARLALRCADLLGVRARARQLMPRADDGIVPLPRPRASLTAAIMVALDDYTESNGATVVVKRSHQWVEGRVPERREAEPVVMPAGSILSLGIMYWRDLADRSWSPAVLSRPALARRRQERLASAAERAHGAVLCRMGASCVPSKLPTNFCPTRLTRNADPPDREPVPRRVSRGPAHHREQGAARHVGVLNLPAVHWIR